MTLPTERGSVSFSKLIVASLMILALFATMNWLQGRFAASDHRKAIALVSSYKPKSGIALSDAILKMHPGIKKEDISWSSEIRQSCLGYVRVQAVIPTSSNHKTQSYAFDVNLNAPSVHPTDEVTINILKSLSSTVSR